MMTKTMQVPIVAPAEALSRRGSQFSCAVDAGSGFQQVRKGLERGMYARETILL